MSKKNIIYAEDMGINDGMIKKFDFTTSDSCIAPMLELCTNYEDLSNPNDIDKLKAALLNMLHVVDIIETRLSRLKARLYNEPKLANERDSELMERFLAAISKALVNHDELDIDELKAILGMFLLEFEKINAIIDSYNIDITLDLEKIQEGHMPKHNHIELRELYLKNYHTIADAKVENEELNNIINDVKTENIEIILLNLFYRIKLCDDRTAALYSSVKRTYKNSDLAYTVLHVVGGKKYSRGFGKNGSVNLPDGEWLKILFTFGGPVSGIGARMLTADYLFDDLDDGGLGL